MMALIAALRDAAAALPDLHWAVPLMQDAVTDMPSPESLPVVDAVLSLEPPEPTRAAVQALQHAAPGLRWQQSYSLADGFSQEWLDAYGWVTLISPEGPVIRPDFRLAVAYWGAGQHYPPHAHAPEETYLVLAGAARFEAAGRAPIDAAAGDMIHHASWQPHAMTMGDAPLLAAAFWRGDGLMDRSRLDVALEDTA